MLSLVGETYPDSDQVEGMSCSSSCLTPRRSAGRFARSDRSMTELPSGPRMRRTPMHMKSLEGDRLWASAASADVLSPQTIS
eukprot:748646-Hanusia_phi.AAC.2